MKLLRLFFFFALALVLAGCGSDAHEGHAHGKTEDAGYEKGPHGGRMLRDGSFAIEVQIYETNVEPHFRLYPYQNNKALPFSDITPSVQVTRLDGEVNQFTFRAENGYLASNEEVAEPHSFDITVSATHLEKSYSWTYASYEGRTTIPQEIALESGIQTSIAGPAVIRQKVQLLGNVVLNSRRHSLIRARFPGTVRTVNVTEGQHVKKGHSLIVIEANESMRNYSLTAPFDGVILAKSVSAGDIADTNTLLEIADLSQVWVELQAMGSSASAIRMGQQMTVRSTTGDTTSLSRIDSLLPVTRGQSIVIRGTLPNEDGKWRPGMTVTADVIVSEHHVPTAVEESALQRYQGKSVLFEQVGDVYEAKILRTGVSDGEFVEVLEGVRPGMRYVTQQSFLIKADLEKSEAAHDH